jgi:glycosyltransferase involved in cell wall biosynthesis
MQEPLVSVVVSSYNRPAMLKSALLSLLEQSYQHLEIIVQDDSTNETCSRVVLDFADPRIMYMRNQPSLGTIRNLRAGYRKCTGKYFSTLNDDDVYSPDYIQTVIGAMESNPCYCVGFSDHYIIGQDGTVDEIATTRNSIAFGRNLLMEGSVPEPLVVGMLAKSIPGMFAIFRREMMDLQDFPDEVSSGYDYWLTYLGVRTQKPIYYTPRKLTYYRVHAGSQTSSFTDPREGLRSLQYSEYMHERFLADPRLQSIHTTLTSRLAEIHTSIGFNLLRMNDRWRAVVRFVGSCKTKPTARAMSGLLLCTAPTFLLKKIFGARLA